MKIELLKNKVFCCDDDKKREIHPFWLRERVNGKEFVDNKTKQRLFDPTKLENNIEIEKLKISDNFLEVTFKDGVFTKIAIKNIIKEFLINNDFKSIKKIKWDSKFKDCKYFNYEKNFFEGKLMIKALTNFYQYGFVIFRDVPTENNYLVNFANSIGSIRRTNFGEYFNVKSKPNPNDLAYTSLPLAPHTDNPYRNPVPCIQLLHCIENNVTGGYSTLVDGYTVTEELKKKIPEYYEILSKVKIRFQFIDQSVVLESLAEMIQLDKNNNFKQIRFSPRLDFVPLLEREKLELFYNARKKISELYNSDQYKIEFKLCSGDLLMIDNHRLLHGRTSYDVNEGNRFLQGCYIDYDSTEGKLNHLKRKFNL